MHDISSIRFIQRLTLTVVCCSLATILTGCSTVPTSDELKSIRDSQDLLIVDCLLPSQVRQIGTQLTYLTQRQAIRTPGSNCASRGGEYVAYDRADFHSALSIWLPLAETGDPQAQTYVGEIYEKGLGTRAAYDIAANWYRKAAQQNYPRAQINLGYLYESGLGVNKDLTRALNLYREASGFTKAELEFVSSIEIANRKAVQTQTQNLKTQVSLLQLEIKAGQVKILQQQAALAESQSEANKLRESLNPSLINETDDSQERNEALKKQWEESQKANAQSHEQLEQAKASVFQLKQQQTKDQQQLKTLEQQLIERESSLLEQKNTLNLLNAELLEKQTALNRSAEEKITEIIEEGPSIDIIEPPVLVTRGAPSLLIDAKDSLNVIGRVSPVKSLFSFQINGEEQKMSATGMFNFNASATKLEKLQLIAINDQGEDTRLLLELVNNQVHTPNPDIAKKDTADTQTLRSTSQSIDWGNYHALIIGNNHHMQLTDLYTAHYDAIAVEKILREKYGFDTVLLLDANQKTILQAMERMRATLGSSDNLVIYYAGHGQLDSYTGSGYWLPVDASESDRKHWIANSAITAMIDTMKAKHVLVIADSCYSGSFSRSAMARPLPETSSYLKNQWLEAVSKSQVRTVLSSGGTSPVLDGTENARHSIFASSFLNALRTNTEILEAYGLFYSLQQNVAQDAARLSVEQIPQYAPIRHAGHQAGDFLFVPVAQQ